MFLARPRATSFIALAALAALSGCRSSATQHDVTLRSTCPARTDRDLTLVVTGHDGMTQTFRFEDVRWPFEQTLAPRDRDASRTRWRLDVTLRDGEVVLDEAFLDGDFVPGTRTAGELSLRDPACADLDAGAVDAAGIDAGTLDAAREDAPSDAASTEDAGRRETTGLLLAYPFARGDVGNECRRGADLDLGGATFEEGAGGGLVLRAGHAVSAPLSDTELTQMEMALSVELWFELEPSLALDRARRMVVFYDSTTWYQPLRVMAGAGYQPSFDAGRDLDAGLRGDPSAFEILGGVSTNSTGDAYARPFLAARVADRFSRPRPTQVVYTYANGDEHLYVDGREATGSELRWVLDGAGSAPPRRGLGLLGTRGDTRVWLGNSPTFVCRPPDAGMAGIDAGGCVFMAAPPEDGEQFLGTYRLLALYRRQLMPSEVARHHALGPDADPCAGL
jgi:hypothetical protein